MRRRVCLAAGAAWALAGAGCGGSGGRPPAGLACTGTEPYAGAPPRAPLPAGAWPGPDAAPRFDQPLAEAAALDDTLARLLAETGAPAIDAAVYRPGRGAWAGRLGWRDRPAGLPADADTRFWWASVGKAGTASLVALAEARGLLSLDAPVRRWWPEVPQGDHVRLHHLLAHTSGLLSYNHPSLGGSTDLAAYRTPAELLAGPRERGLLSCPGTLFSYSNTGYLLLGLVLEAVWGQPFHTVWREQLALPLGAPGLQALAPGEQPAALALPHAGSGATVAQPGLSSLLGAGNVVGGAGDWVRLWVALLDARLHPAPERRWATLLPMGLPGATLWYGQGTMAMDFDDGAQPSRLWLGHTGGGTDANAIVLWDPAKAAHAAVAVNSAVPAAAVARVLLDALVA